MVPLRHDSAAAGAVDASARRGFPGRNHAAVSRYTRCVKRACIDAVGGNCRRRRSAAALAGDWTQVQDAGRSSACDLGLALDHDQRVAGVRQALHHADDVLDVALVRLIEGFVQHEQRRPERCRRGSRLIPLYFSLERRRRSASGSRASTSTRKRSRARIPPAAGRSHHRAAAAGRAARDGSAAAAASDRRTDNPEARRPPRARRDTARAGKRAPDRGRGR